MRRKRIRYDRVFLLMVIFLVLVTFLSAGIYRMWFYQAPRDNSLFYMDNGFINYSGEDIELIHGIDVSSHQAEIDWQRVANTPVEFAMIRAGYRGGIEGLQHQDEYFDQNMQQAAANGIKTGVYFYSSAITMEELEQDAQLVLDMVSGYQIDYPIAFDMEIYDEVNGRINSLTMEEKTSFALRFCEIMEENGYQSMIYGNLDWLYSHLNFEEIQDKEIWYAAYLSIPQMNDEFRMWQYTNTGQIDGISTNVDMNVWLERAK